MDHSVREVLEFRSRNGQNTLKINIGIGEFMSMTFYYDYHRHRLSNAMLTFSRAIDIVVVTLWTIYDVP